MSGCSVIYHHHLRHFHEENIDTHTHRNFNQKSMSNEKKLLNFFLLLVIDDDDL